MYNVFQVKEYYDVTPQGLALRRLPALFITLTLELLGGVIINQLHEVSWIKSSDHGRLLRCCHFPPMVFRPRRLFLGNIMTFDIYASAQRG